MNKFLISILLFLCGTGIGAGLIAARSITPVNVLPTVISVNTLKAQAQNDWPYCNEPPAPIPFFDPCPEGSHVDKDCATKCGQQYQEKMKSIMEHACDASWLLYLKLLVDIDTAEAAEATCNASGTSQNICYQIYRNTMHKLDNQYGLDRDKIAAGVARDTQQALNDYFNCLFACPCLQNGVVK